MKRIFAVLLCAALLCSCGVESGTSAPADSHPETTEEQKGGADGLAPTEVGEVLRDTGCVITTEHPAYGPDVETVTVLLENRSDAVLETGAAFSLEVDLRDGDWRQLKPSSDLCWIAIAYVVQPGETMALQCNLLAFDRSSFNNGRFRIVKSVGDGVCTAEFTVSDDAPITAERPYGFVPLEDLPDTYSVGEAEADGCLVFSTGQPAKDEAAMHTFLTKIGLGIPCQLRILRCPLGESATLEDVIYENISGVGGRFTYRRMEKESVTEEQYYSYLNTDAWSIYLSDALLWNDSRAGEPLALLAGDEAAPYMAAIQTLVDAQMMANVTRCRVWNASGTACAGLTEEPLEFSVSTPGKGSLRTVEDAEIGAAITNITWTDEDTLLLELTNASGGAAARRLNAFAD